MPLAALAGFAAILCGCTAGSRSVAPPAPAASIGQQSHRQLSADMRSTPLITAAGKRVSLETFAGKVLVISDAMTLCQETCPLDTANLVAAARATEAAGLADRVEFLSITVDPDRDTPARLAAYQRLFAPTPANWTLLTGTPDAIAALWRYLGVFIQKVPDTGPAPRDWLTGKPLTYDITHSDELFFVDPNGSERFLFTGSPHVAPGTQLPQALLHFLDETGMNNLNRPGADAWTVTDELEVLSWLLRHPIPSAPIGSPTR